MAKRIVRRSPSSARTKSRSTSSTTTRRRAREEEEEFEDPDGEEERPRRRARAEKSTRSTAGRRRSRDEDDEDDPEDKIVLKGGRAESERQRAMSQRDFGTRLDLEPTPHLIRFLEPEPFVSYRQHWVEYPGDDGKPQKRSYPCAENQCPLCEMGDEPRFVDLWNILDFGTSKAALEEPENKYLQTGVKLSQQLNELADDEKIGPLDRKGRYFSISRTGNPKNLSSYTTTVRPVKERDLEEDWDIEPPDPEVLEEAMENLYDADKVVGTVTRTQLREVAAKAAGEDLDYDED